VLPPPWELLGVGIGGGGLMFDLQVPYDSELYEKERHFCAVDHFKFHSNHISVLFLLLQQMASYC